ncbi:MAG: TetR/AcrR family transcriptional regulator [Gemmiger sp.]
MTQKRGQQVEKGIKDALAKLLAYRDLPQITVAELARSANLTRKTFYAHYSGLQKAADDLAVDLAGEMLEKLENAESLTLADAFAILDGFAEQNGPMLEKMREGGALNSLAERVQKALQRILAKTVGLQPEELPHTAQLALSGAASGVLTLYLDYTKNRGEESFHQVCILAEQIVRSFLEPFLQYKGEE